MLILERFLPFSPFGLPIICYIWDSVDSHCMLIMTYYIFEDQGDESEFKESDYRKEV